MPKISVAVQITTSVRGPRESATETASEESTKQDDSTLSSSPTGAVSPSPLQLPEGYRIFKRQAGGHHHGQGRGKIGLLVDMKTSRVLKHLPYVHSQREVDFYETMIKDEREGTQTWPPFIPRYYGMKFLKVGGVEQPFIELDDFTIGLKSPNILDVKLGGINKRTDTPERIAVRGAKYPLYETLGFRLDGCLVYNRSTGKYKRLSAKANKTKADIKRAVRLFLKCGDQSWNAAAVVRTIRPKLEEVEEWLSNQTKWHFYSPSILIAYESHANPSSPESLNCRLAFVDFVHSYQARDTDQVCLRGLRKLKAFLERTAIDSGKKSSRRR